jgi:hypothetical protein
MKKRNGAILFLSGLALGVSLALTLGASDKNPEPVKTESHLQIVAYPAGTTGIFDPDSGTIYLYDVNLANCYSIRKIVKPGSPMQRLMN